MTARARQVPLGQRARPCGQRAPSSSKGSKVSCAVGRMWGLLESKFSMMNAPQAIADLVARFEQQLDAYKAGHYNETQLRREFLDPLARALGWDMDNTAGYAEAYKDVVHED